MLCRGYQRYAAGTDNDDEVQQVPGLPGIWSNTANRYVQSLKQHPWTALPSLLGKRADKIVFGLLKDCGLFQSVESSSNFVQISGMPMSDLKVLELCHSENQDSPELLRGPQAKSAMPTGKVRGLSDIQIVRSRMLYARPGLSDNGHVRFGLNHVHALNRYSDLESMEETQHVMRYVFPRQFGLHNVFTCETDRTDTTQPFKDYTTREQEISQAAQTWRRRRSINSKENTEFTQPIPKRLRGGIQYLVARLRKKHKRCSYATMLEYYCPRPTRQSGNEYDTILQATPPAQVSAFCRQAISKVLPAELWGDGETGARNRRVVMHSIDRFVRLRRYESLTLHDIMQKIKVHDIAWMRPPGIDSSTSLSASDSTKRKELMAELLYFLFDSFLIPLIRGHFHVTESNVHRNQLFYFRQDVWKAISDPALASLKESMLEPCKTVEVKKQLGRRALGVSQVRLLPKQQGMRPIINLRRRVQKMQYGQLVLGKSINSILTPTFSILNFEKSARPDMLRSAMFSVEDIYPRLQAFRESLPRQSFCDKPLYFAKVDVKACFDTIPQKRLMELARSILSADAYRTTKYARSKLVGHSEDTPEFGARPSWRFLTKATSDTGNFSFSNEVVDDTAHGRSRTVYVDGVVQRVEQRKAILSLLEEHVESNLIKLDNRFYRQKEGIPQGSIVSSILCSFFYSELERQTLSYINDGQSILLRLIDDFLVISTKRNVAERFMRDMHQGLPEFGVEVKAEKSRANFEVEIDGKLITQLPGETDFPYCGNAINTVTLDLSKDKERRKQSSMSSVASRLKDVLTLLQTLQTP